MKNRSPLLRVRRVANPETVPSNNDMTLGNTLLMLLG
jgi:hypothetical protein